jgi:tetratricopeptide (TPR) repeat protein
MVKITRVGRRSVSGFMLASLLIAGQVSALEPKHETRRLMLATEGAVSAENWDEAGEYLSRLQQLEGEKPANYFYFRGRVMLESGHYNEAQAALEKYVSLAGGEGEHYTDALKMITNVEKARQKEGANGKNNGAGDPAPVAIIEPAGEQSLGKLRELYLADSDAEALVIHANTLLDVAGWREDQRIVRLDRPADVSYRIDRRNDIISIQESRREPGGRIVKTTESMGVFGVNPQIEWNCESATASCWIYDPRDGSRLMKLSPDREQAEEIARTLGRLIRTMQNPNQS